MQTKLSSATSQNNNLNEEIDLFEVWQVLWGQKRIILSVTFFVFAFALMFVLIVTPVFQSKTYLLPPEKDSIQELNRFDIQLNRAPSYSSDIVMKQFIQNLNSRAVLFHVFSDNNLIDVFEPNITTLSGLDYEKAFNKGFNDFLKSFHVAYPKKNSSSDVISVDLSLKVSPEEVQDVLSDALNLAIAKTKHNLVREVLFEKQAVVDQIQKEMNKVRLVAKAKRQDRIVRFDEAISIARKLNLADPKEVLSKTSIQDVNVEGFPLYYLGYRFLEAEREALLQRKSDDPFIPKLRGLEERLALVNAVEINQANLQVVKVDGKPSLGEKIKPKALLILAVSIIVGGMLGIFIALLRQAILKRREVVGGNST